MTQQTPPPGQPPFRGTGGRDPRQPFGAAAVTARRHGTTEGQHPVAPPPPRRIGPLLVSIAVMLLVTLGTWAASRWYTDPTPAESPAASATPSGSQSPVPRPTVAPTATGPRSQVPFTSSLDNSSGTFRITGHRWTSTSLELAVQVHLDRGTQRLGFFCLDNTTARDYDPSRTVTGQLDGRDITAGQTLSGKVVFDKPQGDTTVYLTDSSGRQVAALQVNG